MDIGDTFHNTLILPNIGEFIGSVVFSFLACFCGQNRKSDLSYPLLTAVSLYISRSLVTHCTPAHFNPAVTILQCIRRQISVVLAISFIVVQLIGFTFGVAIFRTLVSQTEFNDDIIMYELVESEGLRRVNRLQAFILEIVLTIIFLSSFNNRDIDSASTNSIISLTWGFIQFVALPLFGFTSNISLLFVSSFISWVFSPTTTPSFSLLYLNVFAMIFSIFLAFFTDLATRRSTRPSPTIQPITLEKDNELV